MKILLLTLVLGLVCAAQEPQSETNFSLVSGEWKTIYATSSNIEKISENGPFRAFVRRLDFDSEGDTIAFTFFVKVNGQCTIIHSVATKIEGNVYISDYAGINGFKILDLSENAMIGYILNVDEEGLVTKIIALLGKGNDINEEDIEKFKELTRQRGIPEENIVNIINIDDCPTSD
ncbi:odorant-binding protein-like [Diceros bicornis minor]|uniref:odorant-binding protein-like n=1 Tax=Diceros bicornis minor TaxID=77932 RepID=UPI0026EC2237|nr:odorant-binding protein-like [Diceros bicornis minor]